VFSRCTGLTCIVNCEYAGRTKKHGAAGMFCRSKAMVIG
jgi:hypothetical protein